MFPVNEWYFSAFSPASHVAFVTKTGQAVKPALLRVLCDLFGFGYLLEKQIGKVYWVRVEYQFRFGLIEFNN